MLDRLRSTFTAGRQAVVGAAMLAIGIGAVAYGQGFTFNNLLPGTALQPAIASNIDTTTGIYFPSAGIVNQTAGGTVVGGWSSRGYTFTRNSNAVVFPVVCQPGLIGPVAYSSLGNATTNIAGKILWSSCPLPANMTVTNVNILNGGTVGTDKGIVAVYSPQGVLQANSALAGVTTAGANAFQAYPLTAPIAISGPQIFYIAYQANGTTDNIRTVAASTAVDIYTQSATGAFGTLTALTVPTTFTANIGPIAFLN